MLQKTFTHTHIHTHTHTRLCLCLSTPQSCILAKVKECEGRQVKPEKCRHMEMRGGMANAAPRTSRPTAALVLSLSGWRARFKGIQPSCRFDKMFAGNEEKRSWLQPLALKHAAHENEVVLAMIAGRALRGSFFFFRGHCSAEVAVTDFDAAG